MSKLEEPLNRYGAYLTGRGNYVERSLEEAVVELKTLMLDLVHSATKVSVEAEKELEGMIDQL